MLHFLVFLIAWFTAGAASAQSASSEPRQVGVGIWVLDIDSIDSAGLRFVASVVIVLDWQDPTLAHAGPGPERHPLDEVWNPGIQILNEIGLVRRTLPELVVVDPDGGALYRQHFVGSFTQPLDFTEFPFDQHRFSLHFVATGYSPEELEFRPAEQLIEQGLPNAAGIAPLLSLPDWDILGWEAKPLPYEVTPQLSVAGYSFQFTAARRSSYYLLKIILPLVLIVLMPWAVFWIDADNTSSKISVSVTAMLTLIAYRFAISAHVPPVPYMTRLDRFIMAGTVLVFLTLVEVVLMSRLARAGSVETARRLDLVARWLFPVSFLAVGAWALL